MNKDFTTRLEKIEAVIDTWLPENPDFAWQKKVFGEFFDSSGVEPNLALSLTGPARDLLKRGGKRWRPLLMLLVSESLGGEAAAEIALPYTPLIEFPHNGSLIHDDIEDNADERRGKPAVHLLHGMDLAINSGSFMYFLPLACFFEDSHEEYLDPVQIRLQKRLFKSWASHMRGIHLGQAMDISWHRDFNSLPSLEEYDKMCRLKTGCLASLAAVSGFYSALAFFERHKSVFLKEEAVQQAAKSYSKAAADLGLGFQILDDVKNLETGLPGKKRGDDIVEGKKSLPVLLYLNRNPGKLNFAAKCFKAARQGGTKALEVEEFIAALTESGVLAEARKKAVQYIDQSKKAFLTANCEKFPLLKEGRDLLEGFFEELQ